MPPSGGDNGHNAGMTTSDSLQHRDGRGLRIAAAVIAAVGMLGVGFFYLASGLVAPIWAIVLLWLVWLVLAWYGLRLSRAGSYLVLAVPILAGAILFLVLTLGERAWAGRPSCSPAPPAQPAGRVAEAAVRAGRRAGSRGAGSTRPARRLHRWSQRPGHAP